MAEEIIPGFEIVEEQEEKEIIPGFEVVEKQEVVAENTASVTAQDQSGTESSSENTSLESQKDENDPKNLGKKDLKVEKKSKGKIKVPKNSENIPEGKYDVIETYDLTSLNDEEKTKIQNSFNRKNVDLSNIAEDADKLKNQSEPLTRLEEDTDRSSGNLVSLKKINYNYTEPETKKRINRPGEDKESTVETIKGSYYIPIYKRDGDRVYDDGFSKVENFLGNKIKFPRFDTSKEVQGDTPIYLTEEQEEELFGKKDDVVTTDQVTIRDPKDETLKEVVVTAESSLIPANPSEIINEINVIDQELNDPETTPERVEELKENKNNKQSKLVQAYRNNNMLSYIEEEQEKPKPTDWTDKGNYFKNTDNGYEIKTEKDYGQTGIFGRKKKLEKNIREFENLESDAVRDSINEKYINNGIGAIRDGGDVYVYKNPVFKDDGSLDYRKTLEANGMSADLMPDYSKRSRALYETGDFNKLMEREGLFYKANFGIGGNNVEDIEGITNFIDKNISDYQKSSSTAPGAKADSSKEIKEKKKTINLIKGNINEQKSNIQQRTKIILDTSKISEDITKQKTSLRKEFVRSNEEIRLIEKDNKILKEEIDNGSNIQSKKVDQLKKDIANNPDIAKQLTKEYIKWEKGFMSDQKDSIKTYNENLEKEKSISSKYKEFYDDKIPNIESLTEEYNAGVGSFTKLKDEFDGLLADNTFLTALEGEYTASNLMLSGRLEKMSEKYEAQGSYIRELYNTVAGQVAETSVGRVQAFQLFARGINYLGHEIYSSGSPDFIKKAFGINDRQYKSYKKQFAFENASIDSNIKAIKDQLQLSGNDEKFSQEFAQSLVGGTINSFAQMYGAVIGAPLTGLAGGYFFGTLAAEQADAVRVENEFIADHPELSRSEAKKRFDEIWSPASRQGYALAKATVQGALSYVTAGIMKGNIKITEKVVGRVTNSVMKNLTGNVTAKDIQIAVNKKIGDLSAKALSKFGKVTGSGIDELLDETVQTGADYFITEMFNKGTGNQLNFELPAYTSDEFKKEMKHMAGVSFLSGNAGGSFQAMINSEKVLSDYEANNSFAERKQFEKNMEELANTLRSPEDLSVALTQIKEQIGQEVNGEIYTQEQFDEDAFEMNKAFSRFNKIDPNINGKAQMEVAQLLEANEKLEVEAEKLGPNTNARIKNQIEANNKQIQEITTDSNNEISKELTAEEQLDFTEKQLKIVSLQKIKNLAKDQDISKEDADNLLNEAKVEVFNDENVDEIAEKYNLNKEDLLDPEGVYLKDKGVILMSKTATKGVLEHESLHNFLDIALSDPKNKNVIFSIAEALKKQMAEIDPETARKIERQLDKYRSDENYTDADVAEEVLTYYTQLKKRGEFKKGTTVGGEIQAGVRRLFQGLGMEIEINENNVMEVLDDYIRNTGRGKLTRSQRKLAKGKVKFSDIIKKSGDLIASENDTKVIPINKQSETTTEDIKSKDTKMVAAKPISVDTKSMSNSFDQNITEDLKTNDDFKESEAALDAFDAIENNSNFNSYINQLITRDGNLQSLSPSVKEEVNRKIKENLQIRTLKNFKPELDGNRRSLFSFIYGKASENGMGGIAQKALLDVKKEYATRPDSNARSIDKPTSEGQAFDIEDKSAEQDIINRIDSGEASAAPKSQFRRNLIVGDQKGLNNEQVEDFKKVSENVSNKLPDANAKNFRTKLDQLAGTELKSWVKDNILKGQDYKTFIKDNYNNIRDLDIKYLIDLDKGLMKQGKPRMFTKPNRRLTSQADIRKYRDSGRAYVENESQGVMLYDILNPGADATVDFFTKEKPSTVSNRKGKLAESLGRQMFKDALPEIRNKKGESDQTKAMSAKKTQKDPRLLFAKKLDESLIEASQWLDKNEIADKVGFNEESLNESTRDAYQAQMEDAAEKGFLDLDVVLAGQMGSGGKQTFYGDKNNRFNGYKQAEKAGIKNIGKYIKTKDGNFYKLADVKLEDGVLKTFNLDKYRDQILNVDPSLWVAKPGNLYYGAKDPAYIKLLETVGESNFSKGFTKVKIDKKGKFIGRRALKEKLNKKVKGTDKTQEQINMDILDHVVNKLAKSVSDGMSMDIAGMIIVQSYQNTSGLIKASARFAGISNVFEAGKKLEIRSKKLYREEHNPPASVVGASILVAIKQNQAKAVMKDLRKNFTQTILSKKDDSKLDATYPSTMPKGSSIASDPIVRMAMAGINLNTIEDIQTGETYADKFGLGVANTIQTFPGIISLQNKLIEEVVIGEEVDGEFVKKSLFDARKQLDVYAKFPTNGQPSLAKTQNDSAIGNRVELKESKVLDIDGDMNMETLLSKAAGIDEALRLANSLDQPVKKIRVFDFDDTLAKSNNKVFATKGDQTIEMNAEKFASDASDMIKDGWVMDFSDFNNVTDGKRGPLFEIAKTIRDSKGNEDLFVLTARGPESQQAIYDFLKAEGLEFKKENIVGLGKSPGEAKANWILDKAAEGYNDFYFADDAPQNVEAVRDTMSLINVKSRVQLAKENSIPIKLVESKKLDWKTDEAGNIKTAFEIGGKKYNFNLDARDSQGSFDVEFNLGGRIDITGTGNAVKVIRTVYDGLLDVIKQNPKIKRLEFSSLKSEKSRVKLYTTLMDKVAKKLGWETDVWESNNFIAPKNSSYDFEITKPRKKQSPAVEKVLSVIDVKSKTQQARIKESKKLSDEFNDLLEETTGVDAFKEYSAAKAKTIGASKGNFKFFIPYSAEDFLGLIYPTLAKGSKGDAQMAWYKTNLIDKYTKAQENLSTARLNLMNDFKQLKKSLNIPANLRKKNDSGFTNEQAVRVHLFTSMGYEVPGLSKRDLKQLNDTVENDATLKEFSEQILQITKGDGYASPDANWLVGTITTDLINLINTEKRSKYLSEWQESIDTIYSKENLNKLEAIYGTKYVDALTNMLTRMKTGKNRLTSGSKIENQILDYINGSIGTIMFFNTRSAVLQTISSINFVNWSFNNPYQAGKAFANQKQYWSDFKELMNSDYLLDRRNGLKLNISESEIADAAATSKNKAKAAINYLLQKGFLPTQYADSFAIASGGATFYRNRIKDLVRQGKTETEAKEQALIEFRQVAEESQQSSDPSRISQQQSSNVGRLILAFANTPMQYARIQKRAIQDLVNGRGDAKSHVSRIVYYGFVQNVIFNALQQAVFALGFGDDDDDEKEEAKNKKYLNVANGMLDSLLRGLGIGGAAVSVAKNFLMDIYERSGRDRPEYVDSVWEVTKFSPPIYSKLSKLKQAGWQFDSKKRRELIFEKGFSLDNPAYEAAAKVVSATTNVPLDRVMYKIKNIEGALDEDNEIWQRVAMMGGWPKWQLESPKTAADLTPEQKAEIKAKSKIDNYKKAKGSKDYDTIKKLTSDQQIKMLKSLGFGEYTIKNAKTEKAKIDLIIAKNSKKKNIVDKKAIEEYKYKKLNKAEQIRKLDSLGLSKDEIKALKLEADRVEKLVELMK